MGPSHGVRCFEVEAPPFHFPPHTLHLPEDGVEATLREMVMTRLSPSGQYGKLRSTT
jgi:hypothetical protein